MHFLSLLLCPPTAQDWLNEREETVCLDQIVIPDPKSHSFQIQTGFPESSLYPLSPILYSLPMTFTIISVTGAHSKVGKTTLCSILLKNLKGFGAIKCTKTPLYTSVTDDPDIILQKDKDTAIMSGAGAEKVVWVQSSGSELEYALDIAMGKMAGLKGVVVEGNSPVKYIHPHLILFIVGDDGQIKPSAREVCEKAHIIIINSSKQTDLPPSLASLIHKDAQIFRIDFIKKEGEIDKFLAYTRQYIKQLI